MADEHDQHLAILGRELLGELKTHGDVTAPLPKYLNYEDVLSALEENEGLVNLQPWNLEAGKVLEDVEAGGTCRVSGIHLFANQEVVTQRGVHKPAPFTIDGPVTYDYKPKPDLPVSKFKLPDKLSKGLRRGDLIAPTVPMKYGFLHQCAYHGNTETLTELAKLPGVDLALPNLHGETILQIAQHRLHADCTRLARDLLDEQYGKAARGGDVEYQRHVSRTLAAPMHVIHTGVLSNIPHAYHVRPAPVMQSGHFMWQCLQGAQLEKRRAEALHAIGGEEDWLFARQRLDRDGVLSRVLDYVKAALPVHRSSHQALANVLAGGSLFGKKRLADFTKSLTDVEPLEAERRIMDMCHKAVNELSEKLFVMCSAHDLSPEVRTNVILMLVKTLRLRLTEIPEEQLPDGVSFMGAVDLDNLQIEIASRKSEIGSMTGSWKKTGGGGRRRRGSVESNAFLDRLDAEIVTLRDSLLTFVRLASGSGVGIGYALDRVFGTDNGLFAMLGPNGNNGYGSVAFAFDKSVLSHPDVDIIPNAATLYHSKAAVCARRPWVVTGVQSVPDSELPTKETAGYGFEEQGTSRPVQTLEGNCTLSDYQGMYAWKFNQLHGYMSLDWEEILAREIVAQARLRFAGLRNTFKGSGKYKAGADPWNEATTWNVDRKIDWDKLRDEVVKRGHDDDAAAELVIKFYESCEGHAKVECHLPGVIHMQGVKHIWMTQQAAQDLVDRRDMHQAEDPGGAMLSDDGLILADGRVLKLVKRADGTLRSDSQRWLTVCADDQELFEKQQDFFRRRLEEGKKDKYAVQTIPGMSFRTESNLRNLAHKHGKPGHTRWLPLLLDHPGYLSVGGRSWNHGFRVMFTANTGDDLELVLASVPDGDNNSDCYKIDIGHSQNSETRLLKIKRGAPAMRLRVSKDQLQEDSSSDRSPLCATASADSGGKAQRYWASLTYDDGKAWLLFGRIAFGANFPRTMHLKILRDDSGKVTYAAADDSVPVCVPILCDETPLSHIRCIGFSCWSMAKAYQHVTIHRAPQIRLSTSM